MGPGGGSVPVGFAWLTAAQQLFVSPGSDNPILLRCLGWDTSPEKRMIISLAFPFYVHRL